ncbi:hypothetical protein [Phyllobacterium leguminum]|uniref:Beta-barrel assembly complex subunit BamF n=1 Tax=Phyllobacterium leguminum TaxID=314237 RepID=A0A318TFE5_9HYPH|nr:hypothetical protein [Phyllobacterium leguminum]PYE90412.1 hypothetical protein C7477_10184 [Phyllobacterium leguminum]
MKIKGQFLAFGAILAGVALSGCVSAPTYGTDKTASAQLIDDMSNIASFGSRNKERIEYKPRPELVKPAGRAATLPAPQESVAQSGGNWPESPEARRKRLRDEATANQDNPNYVSPIAGEGPAPSAWSRTDLASPNSRAADRASRGINLSAEESAELLKRRQQSKTGSPTTRKYLSEPPLEYRQAAASAPTGDLGADEARKERERKAAASGSKSWREYMPW